MSTEAPFDRFLLIHGVSGVSRFWWFALARPGSLVLARFEMCGMVLH